MDRTQAMLAGMALRAVDETNEWKWWEVEEGGQREALFIRLIINLYDALKILQSAGHRLSFKDDIDGGDDIHELVRKTRNAACHITSGDRLIAGASVIAFAVVKGSISGAAQSSDDVLGNPYADDIAIFYGSRRIYLRRHILRAAAEAESVLGESAGLRRL